jgi:GT2 family glycosyltransferase
VPNADPPPPLLSLIVLSFRRFEQTTGPCLGSLLARPLPEDCELLLVDNGSDDGSAEACARIAAGDARIRHLPQAANLGFGGGMNVGVAAARGEWVLLVNSDTLFPEVALERLRATLRTAPPRVAMVGPVTNAAGNGQCLPLPGRSALDAVQAGAVAMRLSCDVLSPSYRTDFFCVAVRRSVWNELGGLDPAFGLGFYEDFDFSLRLRAAGYEQCIAEDVFVAHVGSAVFSTMGSQARELMRRNRGLLLQRHGPVRLPHRREGNAEALAHLLRHAAAQGWSDGLRGRAAWRYAALLHDEPRNPLKRWGWRWRQRRLRHELGRNGIAPAFPA